MNASSFSAALTKMDTLVDRLFERQDGAALALFRILVGILLMKDIIKGFLNIQYHLNSIPSNFREHYYGFEWVRPIPELVTLSGILLPIAVTCVILGLFYRLAMPVTTLIVIYFFLLFPEHYLNHYYMLLLFCVLLSTMPANESWSLDALIKRKEKKEGVPAWCYWVLRLQTEIILVYAGLVKINPDWLRLQPLSTWLRSDLHSIPVIGGFFYYDLVIAVGAYGIILLHTFGAPLLMWRKTRPWIFALYACFHLTNSALFEIGMFPFLTLGATMLFFDPGWPRKLLKTAETRFSSDPPSSAHRNAVTFLLTFWLGLQLLIPLPALLSPNLQTAWTGYRDLFSWRMMLNQRSIPVALFAVDLPGQNHVEFVPLRKYLSERQCTRSLWKPNLTVQVADYLSKTYAEKFHAPNVEIHAYILNGVNYREPELWADPAKNLAAYRPVYGVPEWLEPQAKPFRSWMELIYAPKMQRPTYREVLQAMNLPEDAEIIFDKNDVSLDSTVSKPECEQTFHTE